MTDDLWWIALPILFVLGLATAVYYYRAGWGQGTGANLGALIEQRTRALQESKWRLEESNRTLEQAKHELEESNKNLKFVKSQLEQANQTLEVRVRDGIAALREAERMAAFGQMVAGVAHEVRHPIFALTAASYVISERLQGNEDLAVQLRIIDRETKRMNALMADLLEFARPKSLLLSPASPAQLLQEAMETFKASHPDEPPDITIEAPDSLPPLRIDRARILQVLINLMENARSHASGVTRIALRAGWPSMEEGASIPGAGSISSAAASHSLSGRRPLRLRVCNDGVPIPPEALPRIFEPFFTGGRGTGLGLAIVRRLVEEHGGAISVISNAEIGTEFSIDLPSEGSAA